MKKGRRRELGKGDSRRDSPPFRGNTPSSKRIKKEKNPHQLKGKECRTCARTWGRRKEEERNPRMRLEEKEKEENVQRHFVGSGGRVSNEGGGRGTKVKPSKKRK